MEGEKGSILAERSWFNRLYLIYYVFVHLTVSSRYVFTLDFSRMALAPAQIFFLYTVGSNIKVGSNWLMVGSNSLLMVGSNVIRVQSLREKNRSKLNLGYFLVYINLCTNITEIIILHYI